MSEKQIRSRTPKPPTSFSGMTDQQWRSDPQHLEWAQRNPIFFEIGAVLTNGRVNAFAPELPPLSEGRLLGRQEGYQIALNIFFSLAQGIPKPPLSPEITYQTDAQPHHEPTD